MSVEWYYQVMGETHGPVSSQELKRLADRGDIARDYLVRKADCEDWHFGLIRLKRAPMRVRMKHTLSQLDF